MRAVLAKDQPNAEAQADGDAGKTPDGGAAHRGSVLEASPDGGKEGGKHHAEHSRADEGTGNAGQYGEDVAN